MSRNPMQTDNRGYPLCYGEEYEEDHDICVDCHVYKTCGNEYDAALEKQNARIKASNLMQIGLPGQTSSYQNPSMASYLDVTRNTYPYQSTAIPSPLSGNYTSATSSMGIRPTQQMASYNSLATLMKNPTVPNQFDGEGVILRIIKNAVIAAMRMIALEIYRSLEIILGKWLWPPNKTLTE